MPGKAIETYYRMNMRRAGLTKYFTTIENDKYDEIVTICYTEKGAKVPDQPSIVFIHGFSSDKHTWIQMIKNIPDGYHCIAIDMPGHGETVGFNDEQLTANNVVDTLKLFFDKLELIEPMCFVGTSMGGSIVAMFAMKYNCYVSMICLLAPVPPGEEFETDLMRQIRTGTYQIVLPETHKQFYAAADALSSKKIHLRRLLANGYLKLRLSMLDQHKKVLKSALENDYPNLEQSYASLKHLTCPALILWGRNDQLCAVEGAFYFSTSIPKAELIFLEDCGHLITSDKPREATQNILNFWERHQAEATRF